jgi:hypothetical protein
MKKLLLMAGILAIGALSVKNVTLAKNTAPRKATHVRKNHVRDGSPLLFWTSNRSYGPIEIFVNDVYQGDITASYGSAPECAAEGCVTVMIYGDHNVWTAQTKDGRVKWASKAVRLEARECNSQRLL